MNRRNTIKHLFAASGALTALPSWARGWTASSFKTFRSSFNKAEQEILSAVVDTIIPAGNAIGAKSVGVDLFLQKLFDRCYEKEVQDNVKKQLQALESKAQAGHQTSYAACPSALREQLLLQFASSEIKEEKDFFTLIKSETIRGFNTSEQVMVQYLKYKVAPGHYYGCVDVNA
ncbi:MAG TPA: gluconate 2-dehydrogenase subunit 3 family protein [Saprospiraceae bacterium]|nr:gluconate 2-dehydrogenase subunit 3 family protein [Saprospiraceae bacterium]HNT20851.1 gluconate 2-dehydrogenase subunit 3 family protein [Saprospiraceae bacterium]